MRYKWFVLGAGVLLGLTPLVGRSTTTAGAETYKVDAVHSTALFRVKHLGVSYFYGRFNKMSGTFTYDKADPSKCAFEIKIKARSIDTNSNSRDKHLKSPDFFNVREFPDITFQSTIVTSTEKNQYEVTGDLTLHGVTKAITVPLEHIGSGSGMRGGRVAGFEGTFTIKRSDFGMNFMLDKLGDEVRITISFEGARE